jgi:hypothetical protein
MSEKTINGTTYKIGQLPARTQWNVARRVMPLLEGVAPAIGEILKNRSTSPDPDGGTQSVTPPVDWLALGTACVGPLTKALSNLSDAESDYVINACLSVVTRPNANNSAWVKFSTAAGQPMFQDDNDLRVIMPLVGAVLWENVGSFLAMLGGPTDG